jgi:AcrR family transcriptional regulator
MSDVSDKPGKRLGRPPRADNQRERILHEAAVLFARSGFAESSMSDLAEETGISKAGIYHYFRTKQDVYDAIIVQTLQGLVEHVDAVVAGAGGPPERLLAFMTAHADFFERNYWAFCAMLVGFSGMRTRELRHEAVELRERYEHLLRRIIAEGVAHGDFRGVDPAATGRAVLSMLNWMARWFRPGGPRTAPEVAREYADLLFGGLRR